MVKLCIGDFPLISAGRALRPVITGPKKNSLRQGVTQQAAFNGKVARGLLYLPAEATAGASRHA
jgi:hypothetical protein